MTRIFLKSFVWPKKISKKEVFANFYLFSYNQQHNGLALTGSANFLVTLLAIYLPEVKLGKWTVGRTALFPTKTDDGHLDFETQLASFDNFTALMGLQNSTCQFTGIGLIMWICKNQLLLLEYLLFVWIPVSLSKTYTKFGVRFSDACKGFVTLEETSIR